MCHQICHHQTPPEDPFFEGRKICTPFSCIKAAVGLVKIPFKPLSSIS